MAKGQAFILLAVLFVAVLVIFFSPQIFRPTSVTLPVVYKNDIITLENFEVSNLRPTEKGVVTISFGVTNNGDMKVGEVIVDLSGSTNVEGGKITFEECELATKKDDKNMICVFKDIESLDSRKVIARFQVGSQSTQRTEVMVRYRYSGAREAIIPIVDDKTVKGPPSQFSQSVPSFGPFVVDVIPPTKRWAIADQPFEIKFKVRHAGSFITGVPDRLKAKNFAVNLIGLKIAEAGGKPLSCQFLNFEELLINNEYGCNLQVDFKSLGLKPDELFGYKLGRIEVKFFYDYRFQKSQIINVIKSV